MSAPIQIYVAIWLVACVTSAGILIHRRKSIQIFNFTYWRFLTQPWKLATFAISGLTVTFLGPYTTDPTWDWVDGGEMSILAFTTAPWVLATLYRINRSKLDLPLLFAALCVWFFSASWVYDGYLLLRDGFYPETWWANLIASSVLYICAGLFWSLAWIPGKGTVLAFREPNWPQVHRSGFKKIFWIALPIMALVAWMILVFVRR